MSETISPTTGATPDPNPASDSDTVAELTSALALTTVSVTAEPKITRGVSADIALLAADILHPSELAAPTAISRAVTDISSLRASPSAAELEHFSVRPCRVEDTAAICWIMCNAWPKSFWRNERYWTKQFLENTARYGFVVVRHLKPKAKRSTLSSETVSEDVTLTVESAAGKHHSECDSAATVMSSAATPVIDTVECGDAPDAETGDTKSIPAAASTKLMETAMDTRAISSMLSLTDTTSDDLEADDLSSGSVLGSATGGVVVGFAMYMWNQPGPSQRWTWRETDFPAEVQSHFSAAFDRTEFLSSFLEIECKQPSDSDFAFYKVSLAEHRDKWHSHFVHFTDIAIHPTFRGKGLGTRLVQSIIYAFPNATKFGLEVESTNIGAVKCYAKCGFEVVRVVTNYYGLRRHAYKMTLVSAFDTADIELFIRESHIKFAEKRKERVLERLRAFAVKLKKYSAVTSAATDDEKKEDASEVKIDAAIGKPEDVLAEESTVLEKKPKIRVDMVPFDGEPLAGDLFIEAVLTRLGLSAFVEDFATAEIDSSNLVLLSEERVSEIVVVPEYAQAFIEWLREYKKTAEESATAT